MERVVFIQDNLVSEILFYAQELALGRNDFLFRSRKGGHITKQRADQIIKKAAQCAKLEQSIHADLFRHGCAINFLNCSGRLDALQEQLGHRDVNTTRIHLRLSDEDTKREVAKDSLLVDVPGLLASRGQLLDHRPSYSLTSIERFTPCWINCASQ